jgi:probable phosphoglycerate mutase
MRIIAIRHGETSLNGENRLTGWQDDDLTAKGWDEARAVANSLDVDFELIVSSTLLRAVSTARTIAAKHPCRIVSDPNLRERNFGSLNGKSWEEIEAETGKDLRHLDVDLMAYDYRPYGGESVEGVTARVKEFLRSACQLAEGRDFVAVTHGGVIKLLYTLLESEGRKPITNCSVHVFHPRLVASQGVSS